MPYGKIIMDRNIDTVLGGYVFTPRTLRGVGVLSEDGTGINFTISDQTFTTDPVNVDIHQEVDLKSLIQKLSNQISASTAPVNTKLTELSNYINKVNDMISEVNNISNKVSDIKDDIQTRINNAIDRINNRAVSYINRLNTVMQPVMLVEAANGPSRISQAYTLPSHLASNNLQLLPTTMNGELLAPAYKKFVAVLKAIKNDGSNANDAAEAKRLNEDNDLLKVFDGGGKKAVKVEGLKSGYIYEIVYMAADYRGLVAARKYYVTVD
jgi:hypothetical protein